MREAYVEWLSVVAGRCHRSVDPLIAGELEVTGFSDFLRPVNDALLLGLGRAAEGGIKLELFDISDITDPLSRGSGVLGGAGSRR